MAEKYNLGDEITLKSEEKGKIVGINTPSNLVERWDYIIELDSGQSLKILKEQIEEVCEQ